jgi:hypothetical protein
MEHRYVNPPIETHEKYAAPLMWLTVGVDESIDSSIATHSGAIHGGFSEIQAVGTWR